MSSFTKRVKTQVNKKHILLISVSFQSRFQAHVKYGFRLEFKGVMGLLFKSLFLVVILLEFELGSLFKRMSIKFQLDILFQFISE